MILALHGRLQIRVLLLALQGKHQEAEAAVPSILKGAKKPWVSSRHLPPRPHLRAGGQERRSPEVAARDGQRRLPLLPALCARLVPGPDPQRAGFHSVHGRDEDALGRLPARVRMRLWCDDFPRQSLHYRILNKLGGDLVGHSLRSRLSSERLCTGSSFLQRVSLRAATFQQFGRLLRRSDNSASSRVRHSINCLRTRSRESVHSVQVLEKLQRVVLNVSEVFEQFGWSGVERRPTRMPVSATPRARK